jgi:phage terminase large subunit GpA-like protein
VTAVALLEERLDDLRARLLSPPPKLTVSEWADRYRYVAAGTSAEPGQWKTQRAPYLRAIMDAVSDPRVERVVMQKPRRVGGTEALNNIIGYFIHQDPAPIILVQPTVEMAEEWSRKQLAPMLAATPALRGKVKDARSRDSGNTMLSKQYPGGYIAILGANSGAGFRMRTARVVCGDEIDAWPESAGSEGDPVELLVGRTDTYHNRKVILCSTPLLKGFSRIEDAYLETNRAKYYLPCLECGEYQVPKWKHIDYKGNEPQYLCEHCGVLSPETAKYEMVRNGQWIADQPDIVEAAGFQWSQLISLFDGARWGAIVEHWQKGERDPTRRQVFINQRLGETWEDRGSARSPHLLAERTYQIPEGVEVPAAVGLLTCGVDVQEDRLEAIVRGWGRGEESWLIRREILLGDPAAPQVWAALEQFLAKQFSHESGATIRIHSTCIDSGYHTEAVYRFCAPRYGRGVFATKGASTPGKPMVPRRPTRNNKYRCPLFLIGTETAKDTLYGRLDVREPGPLFWHYPIGTDADYFQQLTAERRVKRQMVDGRWISRYELPPHRRNEVADCECQNIVALALSGAREQLGKMAERIAASAGQQPAPIEPEPADPSGLVVPPRRTRGGFATGGGQFWRPK